MKTLKSISGIIIIVALMALFGCGGGGDDGTTQPTTATLKLQSQGTVGTVLRGIEVTIVLPQGVTVKASPSTVNPALLETDPGVVVPSGATAAIPTNITSIYTPATATTLGTVAITLVAQADFNLGEYVTVNSVIAAGSFPKATDFSLLGFTAVDLNGNIISGASPQVTSSILAEIR